MPALGHDTLARLLLESGCQIDQATPLLTGQPGRQWIGKVLDSGQVDETRFAKALADLLALDYLEVAEADVDPALLEVLPSRFAFQHHLLPLTREGNTVRLACYDPFNEPAARIARQLTGAQSIRWVITPRLHLLKMMKQIYGVGGDTFDEILRSHLSRFGDNQDEQAAGTDLDASDEEASVSRFVNQVIREAIRERATDIHIEPLESDIRIRYRIDGMLQEVAVPKQLRVLQSAIIARVKVMARMDIAERRLPQDGRIGFASEGFPLDVRVSTIPTVHGESVSLRLLSRQDQAFGLSRLNLFQDQEQLIAKLLFQPNGIILLTGPTGCGKSTSLYCFLTEINSVERRIITIEEPVEYRLPGVMQIEVRSDIGLTFAQGLRHILRQDPNVIMVGEIRDLETAEIAVRSAMTGHLVFSTLHTNDAVGGITRLLDMGIEPFLVASVVRAFMAQRLVRSLCNTCKKPHAYDALYLKSLGLDPDDERYRQANGCEECRQTGYHGRLPIFEVCPLTEGLRHLVVERASGSHLKDAAVKEGLYTLRDDGFRRAAEGWTSLEEVLRVTHLED